MQHKPPAVQNKCSSLVSGWGAGEPSRNAIITVNVAFFYVLCTTPYTVDDVLRAMWRNLNVFFRTYEGPFLDDIKRVVKRRLHLQHLNGERGTDGC